MQQMGLQARLMSQALRKMSGNASKAGCTLIFLNQIRYKVLSLSYYGKFTEKLALSHRTILSNLLLFSEDFFNIYFFLSYPCAIKELSHCIYLSLKLLNFLFWADSDWCILW